MYQPAVALGASALVALSLSGCGAEDAANAAGDSGGDPDVAQVVDRLAEASREGDGARICDELFTENLRISVERASGRECADEVVANVGVSDASYDLQNLTVDRNQATAVLKDQTDRRSRVLFQRVEGQWRIARIE